MRRKIAEQMVTIERLERDKKETNEKLIQLESSSKKFGEIPGYTVFILIERMLKKNNYNINFRVIFW